MSALSADLPQTLLSEQKELSLPEYERLLKCAKTWKNKRMYYVLLTLGASGIRVSELRFITMEALEQGYVQIHSKGKIRCIVLSHALICSLQEYCPPTIDPKGDDLLYQKWQRIGSQQYCHDMKRLCQQAEVSPAKVFPHNFRHLFARRFMRSNIIWHIWQMCWGTHRSKRRGSMSLQAFAAMNAFWIRWIW